MRNFFQKTKSSFSLIILSVFFLLALLNPVFKKYDYGAGWPLVILFGVLVLLFALFEFKEKREKSLLESLILLIFMGGMVMSFVFSETRNYGLSEVMTFLSVSAFYLIFAFTKIKWVEKFLKIVVIGTLLAVIMGFSLYSLRGEVRMFGPFFNVFYHSHVWPNAFALFLLITWPIFIIVMRKRALWSLVLAFSLVLSALLLTYSRGALIAFAGQLILLFIYFLPKFKWKTLFSLFLIILVSLGIFQGANFLRSVNHEVIDVEERVSFANEEGLTSKQERIDFWEGAFKLAIDEPITGYGPYSFRYAYNGIQETFLGNADHPHNIFLKIAAENGFITLFAFLAFLLVIFIRIITRFRDLDAQKKETIVVLSVALAGAFAHNLIDYNFNFFVNLLLVFVFLSFIRSFLIVKEKMTKPVLPLILAILIAIMSLYEGGILFLSELKDEDYLKYSFFPRNYYLTEADETLNSTQYEKSLNFIRHQISLNSLDSQAYYLEGALFCKEDFVLYNLQTCEDSFEKALMLNPLNDLIYYLDYLRVLERLDQNDPKFIERTKNLINDYFGYVKNNVHFTAYTPNVEVAAEIIDHLIPYLSPDEQAYFLENKEKMLETANKLRLEKTY